MPLYNLIICWSGDENSELEQLINDKLNSAAISAAISDFAPAG